MTSATDTLLNALEHCGMVEIDGYHAFEFSLDEDDNLHIECMAVSYTHLTLPTNREV